MSNDQKKFQLATRLKIEGRYKEALNIAYRIEEPSVRAAFLIDCGTSAKKTSVVREGIQNIEEILKTRHRKLSKASLLYNLGNGYSSIYMLRRLKGVSLVPPNDDDLRKAKHAYRESLLEKRGNPASLRTQTLVNYANSLSAVGRTFEAIEAYNRALRLDPKNGMAAGNMGTELERVIGITGRYVHHYSLFICQLLQNACGPEMHLTYGGPEAEKAFRAVLDRVQKFVKAKNYHISSLRHVVLKEKPAWLRRYFRFCLENSLFLNTWVGDQSVAPAISDEISYGPITASKSNAEVVPELLRVLNEIKEAFITARYLYYVALSKSIVIEEVSEATSYFGFDLNERCGLPIGLCKSAYILAFNILDKVARIANIGFRIGKRNDTFWQVFAEKQSRGEMHEIRFVARPAIVNLKNYSLYALSDLCIDYFESEDVDLKTIDYRRNRITHDYLAVFQKQDRQKLNSDCEITADELYRQTMAVLKLAKYSILYIVSAINISEKRKKGINEVAIGMKYEKLTSRRPKLYLKLADI